MGRLGESVRPEGQQHARVPDQVYQPLLPVAHDHDHSLVVTTTCIPLKQASGPGLLLLS